MCIPFFNRMAGCFLIALPGTNLLREDGGKPVRVYNNVAVNISISIGYV